jgi:DNA-binding PadR family transcriptional regulator
LYTALDRLTDDRQVRLVSEEMVAGRVRRSYGLTEDGAAALRAGAQRMAEAARVVAEAESRIAPGLPGRKPRSASSSPWCCRTR